MVGFEPTLSSTPSWRIPRLSHILKLDDDCQSVQWELNPHIHHGKVAGGRYIMDAKFGGYPTQRARCP